MHSSYVLIATRSEERTAICRECVLSLGYDVQVAHDPGEATQIIARDGHPLLVITDDSVPRIDSSGPVREFRLKAAEAAARDNGSASSAGAVTGFAETLVVDGDPIVLRSAIQDALDHAPLAPGTADHAVAPEDALHRMVTEMSHRFRVPLCIAYLSVNGHEHVAAHGRSGDGRVWNLSTPDASLFRDIAVSGEALILPDLGATPDDRDFANGQFRAFRSVAGMPLPPGPLQRSGSVCLLDTEPLTLEASDLDALADMARALGQNLERRADGSGGGANGRDPKDVEMLERLAVTDPLTGLANRRGGDQNIANEISRAKRQKTPLSCILVDVDRFKAVNDTYGHQAGDYVLREIAALLRRTLRAYDVLVRWGGEEFLIVLPGVGIDLALRLGERVRRAVEALPTQGLGSISVSAGVATLEDNYDFEAMLSKADRQLYQAKSAGRNQVA